jgi:hypothetical protein
MSNTENSIGGKVREMETNFISGIGTQMSKYVTTDLYEDISKIYAYLNSKHVSGETDSMGRDKPFFNIVTSARNIYYRATDLDRKNVQITPTKVSDTVHAFLATILIQRWMKKENFGTFLNDWGLDLAGFNSSVVKFVEQGGELHSMVVPWPRLICDQVNFDANPKVETIELTEAELYLRVKTHGYDKDMVEKLCDTVRARELTDGTTVDNKTGYIKIYEIHLMGELELLTGKEKDSDTYVQQMHVVAFEASKEKGKFDDFTLVSGQEEKDPYMLTALLPATDGSISLDGSVKNLFEAQWMVNHSVKSIKDQLDVASKLIFQTSDGNYVGRNVLSAIEQGDILVHAINEPLTQVNNGSHDITSQQSFQSAWKGLAAEINGVSESMMGQVAPSGTAWRQVEALLNESHDLFTLMTENKGLYLEQMLRRFVIPFLKKQMDNSDEISAILDAHNISKIDAMYVPTEAKKRFNEKAVEAVIKALETDDMSQLPEAYNPAQAEAQVKAEQAPLGNQRFFKPSEVDNKTWKEVLKDLEWELDVNITGESQDKNTVLTTLSTALNAVANPAYANNPQAQLIVSKILNATGVISPLEIASTPAPQPQVPQGAPQPVVPPQPLPNQQL